MGDAPPRPGFDLPPLWLGAALLLMWLLHAQWPLAVWFEPPWRYLGWLPIAAAVTWMVDSLLRFRRLGTGIRPFTAATTLVAEGAFRWTRNPMYLGMVVVAFGMAICQGTAASFLVPPLLWLVLDRRFVAREERFLRASLGPAYDDYCRRVRRWL
jgi:protein-S-isoprenylcysteine O-methyltransferase Ste14